MDYMALTNENLRLRKLVLQLELELQEERDRKSQNIELLMKGETLRQRIMLDAITGNFLLKEPHENQTGNASGL